MEERVSDPYCIACGGLVGFEDIYGSRGQTDNPNDTKVDFSNPLEWGSIYRAVFQPQQGSRYRLSGTGRYDVRFGSNRGLDYLKVTKDRDSSNIHQPQADDFDDFANFIFELNFFNWNNEERYPHGYVVHAQCWKLIERRVGAEVENNLELLLEICRERFHENPYDIHVYQEFEGYVLRPVSYPTRRWWLTTHCDEMDSRQSIPLRDPLDIPDIPRLIRHSAQNKAREATKRKTRNWSSATFGSSSSPNQLQRSPAYYRVTQLPGELIFLILDNLSRRADIHNAVMAFNWEIPEMYWKARVDTDLIFELQDQQVPSELDWKFLSLGIQKLFEQPSLQNRKRVLRLIDEIGRRFLERMAVAGSMAESKCRE
ncbi:hypothetical protein FQN54_000871 [Arachnomyces sp. PD_36]|nr:hypothetical protein FQN54_000871 [Arachnomyces sp. PD_36]